MLYKKKKIKLNLYIFFIILFVFLIQFSTNNAKAKIYKVENIIIVEPYDLEFDKLKVIDKAFEKAFYNLISKITISKDRDNIKNIKLANIKNLIESFAIIDEKFVDNNYSANFQVNFDRKDILNYLEKKNIISSSPKEKDIILLPIFVDIDKNQISLYSGNTFYDNWNKDEQQDKYLLQYILPNEDLEDLKLLQKRFYNIEDYEFSEIINKYNLNNYIIAIFFKNNNSFRVLSKIKLNKDLLILNRSFENVELENINNIQKIINDLKVNYENQWKKVNQINTRIKLSLTFSLNSKNLNLINNFEKTLNELDLIYKYNIDNFSSDSTIYKIIYNGTPDKLLSEINGRGFEVNTSSRIWRIE